MMTARLNPVARRQRIMSMRFLTAILLIFLFSSQSHAQNSSSWLCITDQVTGFIYRAQTRAWENAQFEPGQRFIIRRSDREGEEWEVIEHGVPDQIDGFDIGPESSCSSDFLHNILSCHGPRRFVFNRETGRFLTTSISGYWTAIPGNALLSDNNSDTPTIAIGQCTAI